MNIFEFWFIDEFDVFGWKWANFCTFSIEKCSNGVSSFNFRDMKKRPTIYLFVLIHWIQKNRNSTLWRKKQKQHIVWPLSSSKSWLFSFQASILDWSYKRSTKWNDWFLKKILFTWTTHNQIVGQEETLTLFLEYLKTSRLCQLSDWGKEWCQEQSFFFNSDGNIAIQQSSIFLDTC